MVDVQVFQLLLNHLRQLIIVQEKLVAVGRDGEAEGDRKLGPVEHFAEVGRFAPDLGCVSS
jgi:hypothetical protein